MKRLTDYDVRSPKRRAARAEGLLDAILKARKPLDRMMLLNEASDYLDSLSVLTPRAVERGEMDDPESWRDDAPALCRDTEARR